MKLKIAITIAIEWMVLIDMAYVDLYVGFNLHSLDFCTFFLLCTSFFLCLTFDCDDFTFVCFLRFRQFVFLALRSHSLSKIHHPNTKWLVYKLHQMWQLFNHFNHNIYPKSVSKTKKKATDIRIDGSFRGIVFKSINFGNTMRANESERAKIINQ